MLRAHRHHELELNLVLGGSASYLLNDRKYVLRRNSVVWLFPDQDHILLEISPDFEMWIVVYRPALVQRVCTSPQSCMLCESDPAGFYTRVVPDDAGEELNAHLERVRGLTDDWALFNAALGYSLLLAWRAFQDADDATASSLHPAVESALRLMRREGESLSMPDIARQAGLSQSRLVRLFRQQTGLSPTGFRNRVRIERFLQLYGKGRRVSMLHAALEAGFGSYPQFHRVFRQIIGVSPQEHYRAHEKR